MQLLPKNPSLSRAIGLSLLTGLIIATPFTLAEEPAENNADQKKPAEKNPAEKAEVKWQSLFDGKTLKGWKNSEFGGGGEILVENGQIRISFGEGCNGVTYQKEFPKIDYEVQLEAQRVEGTDFFCGMTFPVQESPCSLIIGGWGGRCCRAVID